MIFLFMVRRFLKSKVSTLVITTSLLVTLMTDLSVASRGGGDENRYEFYGIVQARPQDGWQGEWVIGERTIIADRGTQLDETEGLLNIGSCAKVQMRNGRVHEIDSEPMQDCH